MNRRKTDKWALSGSSSSVTSYFALSLKNGHSQDIDKGMLTTHSFGFGWRFAVAAHNADKSKLAGQVLVTCQKTQYSLFFDPSIINNSELGPLTVIVKFTNLTTSEKSTTFPVALPTSGKVPIGSYLSLADFTGDANIEMEVKFSSTFNLSIPLESPQSKLQEILDDSFMGRDVSNTKFYLFKCRNQEGRPTRPRALFANSAILYGHSSYLDTLLSGSGYKESVEVNIRAGNTHQLNTEEYDYQSDSDLDSEADDEAPDPVIEKTCTQENKPGPNPRSVGQATEFDPGPDAPERQNQAGRVISVNGTAFKTWKSLLFYLYTNEVKFKPLSSSRASTKVLGTTNPRACSPKSMYRLCDKIDLPELQATALDAIRQNLTSDNIIDELFSQYTSMYPKVQEVEFEYLMAHLTPETLEKITQKLRLALDGSLPHSFDVFSALIHRMYGDSSKTADNSKRK